jgi:ABC-type dipeptide/oligopeptide/nickel transport system permease subunit
LNESIIEGGQILLYLGIVVTLFAIAIGSTVYVSRRR